MLTRTKKVSRRAETQEALRKSESRFRALIENSFDAIVLNNQEGRITYASPSIQRILGYTPEECLGLLAAQAIHPDDQEPTATLFAHLLATRKSTVTTQYRVRHKNGSWRWIEGTWNNLLSTPEVAAVVINLHDITEQKAAQEREHYLARLSESVSDAIISTDLNYLIRSWNTAAERLYGWNEGEVLGTTALALFTDAQFVTGSPEEFRASLATKGCWQGELIQNTRTGQDVHVLASVSTITTTVGQPVGLVTVNRDITERKTLERKLHEQATLLQVANDAFLVQTQENIITFWNQGAQNLYGWSEAEALGKRASTLLNTQFPIPLEEIHTILQQHHSWRGELRHTTRTGEPLIVDSRWELLDDRTALTILEVNRDITERKQREEQQAFLTEVSTLLASSLDYQTTLRTVARLAVPRLADWCAIDLEHDGTIEQVALFHPDQEIIAWSKHVQQLHQPPLQATVGVPEVIRTGKTLFFPIVTDAMLVAAANSEEELALMRNIGVSSCMIVPLRLGGKAFGTMTFSFTQANRHYTQADVAFAEAVASRAALALEHAQLYRQAKEAREQLEIILQNVADGILVYNQHGQIIYANEAAARMTGMASVQALLAMPENAIVAKFELIDEQGHPFPLAQLPHRRVLAGEQEAQATIGYRDPSSEHWERWSLSTARPVVDEHGKVVFVITILHDLTERVRAERRKEEFIGMASHELKTPVTSLKGFTHVLQRRLSQHADEQALAYLVKIDRQVNKLTRLINDLLDVSKMQTGQLDYQQERFDLAVLVRETAEQLQAVTPHHRLSVEGASPAPVMGDRDRIGQVLINLLTNAIKYSPQADNVLVRVAKDQQQVTISVQDFGMGIAKEHHEKIFERFYQVSHPGQHPFSGLGIGLYLASEIIKRHAGRIWVESSKGQGATFSFTLPLTQEAQSSGLLGEGGCQGEGCV